MSKQRTIKGLHCQSCGRTDAEAAGWEAMRQHDGYTACCNQRAVEPSEQSWDYLGRLVERPVSCEQGGECSHE